jgi:branched-chain amino acid transport system substrate-binding protein
MRRRPVSVLGLVTLVIALVGLVLSIGERVAIAQSGAAAPIKVGLIMPGTGPFTVNAERITTGVRLFLSSKDWQVAGRKIELLTEDDQGDPQASLTKAQKLVERDRVQALIGFLTTPSTYAVRDYVTRQKMPTLAVSASNGLVHPGSPQRSPYMFRSYISYYGIGKALAEWMHAKGGHRKVVLVASNFGGALEPAFAFKTAFVRLGGQIVSEIRPPVATPDWGPWVGQIARVAGDADAVVTIAYGSDAIRMVQAWSDAGLKGRLPLYGGEGFASEMLLPAMGAAAEGVRHLGSYCPVSDTPENQQFFRLSRGAGQYPAENNFYGWTAARTLWEAMSSIGGKVEDGEALVQALRRVRYVGPMGPFHYDENHNPVLDAYVQEVRKTGGELHNACLDRVAQLGHPADIPFPPR